MLYLLDTNILSDLVRNPRGRIRMRVAEVGEGAICTSVVVAAELRFGAAKRASAALADQVEAILEPIPVLAFDQPADQIYAGLRASLEIAGTPIGSNDYLIAAHALTSGCILVTNNEREFARVPGLTVENWLRT